MIAPQFMFVSQMYQPYHTTTRKVELETELEDGKISADAEVSVYLDGFAYCGIFNLQEIS